MGKIRAVILTRNPYLYTVRRFLEAGRSAGWDVKVVDPHLSSVRVGDEGHRVLYGGDELGADVVLSRLSSLSSDHAVMVLSELERSGALTINPAEPTLKYRNKFVQLMRLDEAGLPVPETVLVRNGQDINAAVDSLGGPPVVLKYLRGTQGLGVILAESHDAAASIIESLNLIQYDAMLQRYYPEAREMDLRILVLGERAIAGARRVAVNEGFRANFHRGGKLYRYEVPDEIVDLAVRASSALGLEFSGVDVIAGSEGPLVLEVNLSPGFEGMDKIHATDIATEVVGWAAKKLRRKS